MKNVLRVSHTDRTIVIHYACQGFYSCENGKSPRIAAISIFYPSSGQQHLFSIVSLAELKDIDLTSASDSTFDELEKELLKQFYDFVKKDFLAIERSLEDKVAAFAEVLDRIGNGELKTKSRIPHQIVSLPWSTAPLYILIIL